MASLAEGTEQRILQPLLCDVSLVQSPGVSKVQFKHWLYIILRLWASENLCFLFCKMGRSPLQLGSSKIK